MALTIYNSLDKKKVPFRPLVDNQVKMYVCGPTVYDLLHVGNFRGAIFFNLVRNYLERVGYEVVYVYNYTDIDDKIIATGQKEKLQASAVAEKYIAEFRQDFARLKLRTQEHNPRATDFIPQMISFIEELVEKGKAYAIGGEVFFRVDSFANYGKLSGKEDLAELDAGHRVEADKKKENLADFILWKPAKEGEPFWESPWGKGRPGWHIECSTMIQELLGDTIDIHGGGIDLIFPHHENEVAQGEGRRGKQYCRYWMHHNLINFGGEKMSKSLGNITTARDFMDENHPEILKYITLSVHYRSPLSLGEKAIEQSINALQRIYQALLDGKRIGEGNKGGAMLPSLKGAMEEGEKGIIKALDDDFNSPLALAHIFEVVRVFNREKKKNALSAQNFCQWVIKYGKLMALFQEEAEQFLEQLKDILLRKRKIEREKVEEMVEKRQLARKNKNWADADRLRKELAEMGIEVQDGEGKDLWRVKIGE